jgi:hypothetical protein
MIPTLSQTVKLQFGAFIYPLLPALFIGIVLGLKAHAAQVKAMALGAQFSFFVKVGLMFLSKAGWWPITARLVELAFWVACGSIVAIVSYRLAARVTKRSLGLCDGAGGGKRIVRSAPQPGERKLLVHQEGKHAGSLDRGAQNAQVRLT